MLMQNTSTNTIRIPSNMTEGWTGKSSATVAIAPGGIVNIANGYACRQRVTHALSADVAPNVESTALEMPSTAARLSGHALKPYGREANELHMLFVDELPEVIAAQAAHRSGSLGVAASVDAKVEAARREAMEIGFRHMAAQGRLRAAEQPAMQPPVFRPEDLPPDA